jgi:mannan endo-1,4-beta-mannosidase
MEARIAAFRPVVGRGSGRRHGTGTGSGRSSQAPSPTSQSPLGGTSSTTPGGSGPSGGYYWGAAVGTQFTGSIAPWDMTALSDFQNADAGSKSASVLPWGFQFYAPYCNGYCTFVTSLYQSTRAAGMIPWVNWESSSSTGTQGFTDAEIASGSQDAYITQFAQAAKTWGHPFFLRFDWEMNAGWFPWGVGADGNTAADFVAMWRHVHDIFTQVGATNVSWVWCPNVDPDKQFAPLASLYPGDAYVDWTCLDGYNSDNPWTSFQDLFQSSYSAITGSIAPSKPLFVGETASTEAGGSKAAWIDGMFSSLQTAFPQVHGLMWYDVSSLGPGNESDWPLESSASAQAAFTRGIANSAFAANDFSNIAASPIAIPSSAS